MMYTQVGGKYHPDDDSVFQLKRVLVTLGVAVSHPLADEIRASNGECAFAFDPAIHSFADVERHYYDSIRTSDFHIVCNQFMNNRGYLGGSASLETAYAMCHGRPVVVLHPLSINVGVDEGIREFLAPRLDRVTAHDFLGASPERNRRVLSTIKLGYVDYSITARERRIIGDRVCALFDELDGEAVNAAARI